MPQPSPRLNNKSIELNYAVERRTTKQGDTLKYIKIVFRVRQCINVTPKGEILTDGMVFKNRFSLLINFLVAS